jgi:hypothetical protein
MRFMIMHKLDENDPEAFAPSPELIGRMSVFMREAAQAGVLLTAEGLRPSSTGAARITVSDGKRTVIDGPFTETKELIAGFTIVQVPSKEEAVEWGWRFADIFGDIEVDVRQVTEMSDFDPAPPA